ncbi:hypothetical protein [Ramlibacter alkalitolerans]|uniref:Uncharacterized protein n=1 Tax=Ramlibacter alkalitolerans TaxID=2039631 RepID=A0ABS1JV36_9BURK|nr:hypothetical protein [Ramlibacter alkalitolerans]MBL0428118.1 hypothetical protein [Ramlibacter alkalitolerans]
MRDTVPPPNPQAKAAKASRPLVQVPGRRSGEGSDSVLQHLMHDRACNPDKGGPRNDRPA